jgi:predicted ATPase
MLSRFKVEHYKSLFDIDVDLEPLTVFIGPNGSGKSNVCEALAIGSATLREIIERESIVATSTVLESVSQSLGKRSPIEAFFWARKTDFLAFEFENIETSGQASSLQIKFNYDQRSIAIDHLGKFLNARSHTGEVREFLIQNSYMNSDLNIDLKSVRIYDFSPNSIIELTSSNEGMERSGKGIAEALGDLMLDNRQRFDELEKRLSDLVPNISRISLERSKNKDFLLNLVDHYSEHRIPASEVSDGTLRILAFLTAIYQIETPSILCFEEMENGVHPWLLHKMMELLKLISTEGINGKPVQVLITTHSPILLNYVEPKQVRAVELDNEGKTQVHNLPIESKAFQNALDAYNGALGELWFTDVFGGNPE